MGNCCFYCHSRNCVDNKRRLDFGNNLPNYMSVVFVRHPLWDNKIVYMVRSKRQERDKKHALARKRNVQGYHSIITLWQSLHDCNQRKRRWHWGYIPPRDSISALELRIGHV